MYEVSDENLQKCKSLVVEIDSMLRQRSLALGLRKLKELQNTLEIASPVEEKQKESYAND